jgi:peroxin-3
LLLPFDFFFFCSISNTETLLQSLRTRFVQSQEDVAYTILALLPTLSSQVLKEMDIDALTRELQVRSRARSARAHLSAVASRPPSSLASSVDVVSYPTPNRPTAASLPIPAPAIHYDDADTCSDADSVANSSEAESRLSEAEEIYAPSVSAISTSKSAYHTAISGSFMSDTNSVTRS